MRPPLADVVVLVPALDLPARVPGVGLKVETGAVQLAALRNVIPVSAGFPWSAWPVIFLGLVE